MPPQVCQDAEAGRIDLTGAGEFEDDVVPGNECSNPVPWRGRRAATSDQPAGDRDPCSSSHVDTSAPFVAIENGGSTTREWPAVCDVCVLSCMTCSVRKTASAEATGR